jgi:CheY-like chemotaxis protein
VEPPFDGLAPLHEENFLLVTGRRILLLADDSPATQKVVSLTFADEGYEVVAVGDGAEAARRLEAGLAPDIVLADILMPGLTGYELCERIKGDSRLSRVPVMLLVGTFEPFNEAEARRVGADIVLTKPFQSIRDLVNKVGSLIGGAKPEAEAETTPTEPSRAEAAPPAETSSPFADIRMDDEMIESRPAEMRWKDNAPAAPEIMPEPTIAEAAPAPVLTETAHESFADTIRDPFLDAPRGVEERRDAPAVAVTPAPVAQQSPVAEESRVAQPAFAARAASAAAMDDALLDLDVEPFSDTSEADDFILDLALDEPPPASRAAAPVETSTSYQVGIARDDAPAPDAPGAFAEAAHGETSSAPSDEALSAPRSFIEPEVLPADEAHTPAVVEAEFTDGSVEGDVARPPAGGFAEPPVEASAADETPFAPAPSTAGFEMGAARAGVEESAHPDQLSPAAIDAIARRVVEMMSDKVVREIAWEVVPELSELLIKQKLEENARKQ